MPSGGIDLSAAFKAVIVSIISLCFLAQYCALMRACDNGAVPYGGADGTGSVDIAECRVATIEVGMTTSDDSSTWAMAYAVVYSVICGLSFLGCAMIMCKADACARVYALGLIVCTGLLTLFDYWVLIATHNVGTDNNYDIDVVNIQTFKIATIWFMELAIYLNAAYDAWNTDDENQIDKDILSRD